MPGLDALAGRRCGAARSRRSARAGSRRSTRRSRPGPERRAPRFFAEKYRADRIPEMMWELYPRAREVILVRDFRDMVASMFAYNAKRGREGFRRDRFDDDAQYVVKQIKGERCGAGGRLGSAPRPRPPGPLRGPRAASPRTRSRPCCATSAWTPARTRTRWRRRCSARDPETEWHRTTPDPRASIGRWQARPRRGAPAAHASRRSRPELQAFGYPLEEAGRSDMVIGEDFAWAHLPKTGGDATLSMFRAVPRPGRVRRSRGLQRQARATFAARAQQIRGKLLVMNFRRLPSWVLSRAQHVSRRGIYPDYEPHADGQRRTSWPTAPFPTAG